jgi:hypothetical protein
MSEPKDPGGSPTPKPAPRPTGPTPAQVAAQKAAAAAAAKKKAADAAAAKKAADAKKKADAAAKAASSTSAAETAASFGYSLAFFNSNSELKKLLKQATDGGWSPQRFVAALQGTNWFRNTSESYRKYTALKNSDPATYKQQLYAGQAHILNMAAQMGVGMSSSQGSTMADQAMKFGWTDEQLRRQMTTLAKVNKNGDFTSGQAAAYQSRFRAMAEDYGLNVSDTTMTAWVREALNGGQDESSIKNQMIRAASSRYVALADRLKAGETIKQIADPYIQSYGKILEVNPETINIDDPLVQRALQAKDKKGKPATQTVYDFEQTLRKDPRWRQTNNARDLMSSTANAVLSSFGLA